MMLYVKKILKGQKNFRRLFEPMGKGLLLVKIKQETASPCPNHWFLEDGRKPPLDIVLHPETGELEAIKFFFQDEKIETRTIGVNCPTVSSGVPYFSMEQFHNDLYQVFEPGRVDVFFVKKTLYFIFQKSSSLAHIKTSMCLSPSNNLLLFFDASNRFFGFALESLSDSEIEITTSV